MLQALLEENVSETRTVGADKTDETSDLPRPDFVRPSSLIVAVVRGNLNMVQKLLEQGQVALEATTPDGWTALHEAVVHGPEMTRLLLVAGANVNAASDAGYTPLHRAAAKGLREVVQLLVEYGADVSATDAGGNSLLRFAQTSGDAETIALVSELCGDDSQVPDGAKSVDRFLDYLSNSIDKAPQRIRLARAAGHRLVSGGDGYSPERAVVVHAPDIGWGVTFIYEYLEEKFGPRSTKNGKNITVPNDPGWRCAQATSMSHGQRHLNCMEITFPDGKDLKMYFDVTEWCRADSVFMLLMAHARMNNIDSPQADAPV